MSNAGVEPHRPLKSPASAGAPPEPAPATCVWQPATMPTTRDVTHTPTARDAPAIDMTTMVTPTARRSLAAGTGTRGVVPRASNRRHHLRRALAARRARLRRGLPLPHLGRCCLRLGFALPDLHCALG